jgi:transposase
MTRKFFVLLWLFGSLSTCAFCIGRYSDTMRDESQLPSDIDTAHEVILVQSEAIVTQKTQIDLLTKEREELRAEIRFLKSGKKREKFVGADQMLIEFPEDKELQAALEAARKEAEQELESIIYAPTKERKTRKPAANSFPAHLPREEVEVAIPQAFQDRIDSGELFIKHYEYSESIKSIPAKTVVLRYKKPVLAYVNNPEHVLLVEGEANLGEKGRIHPSTAAQIINGKFGLHLPLYRLQDLFASSGWTPSRSSLDYAIELANDVTQELTKVMFSRLMGSNCLGLDDTHVTLIMPKELPKVDEATADARTLRLIEKMREAKKAQKESLDAKMWGYSSFDPKVPYDMLDFRVSRHRDGPAEFLSGYQGHAMADCYSGNMSVILAPESKMTRMACWSHARRQVNDHKDNDASASSVPLALINKIYDVERRASSLSPEARGELRATESRLYLDRLGDWLAGPLAQNLLPSSKLAGAFQYIRNHWDALNEFVTDGSLPIDNNQVERLMRRIAIGRKNWLFVGSVRAGMRNANMMTLVASAHRQDLDIGMYLESVITHMLRGTARVEELLPDVWKQHHPEAVRQYRAQERRDKADLAMMEGLKRRAMKPLKEDLQE